MTILTMTSWPCVSKCKVPLVCCCCCPLESWWRVSGAGTWPGTSPSCGWSGPSCCGCASPPPRLPGPWWPPLRGGACRSLRPVGWDGNVISTPWILPFWTFKTDWRWEKLPYFTIIPHIWGKFHIFLAASLNLLCDWYMWLLNLHCGFYCHSKIFWTQTLNLQVNTILFMIESLYWSVMTSVAIWWWLWAHLIPPGRRSPAGGVVPTALVRHLLLGHQGGLVCLTYYKQAVEVTVTHPGGLPVDLPADLLGLDSLLQLRGLNWLGKILPRAAIWG